MRRFAIQTSALALAVCASSAVLAGPVILTKAEFATETASLTKVVETLDSYTVGSITSPFVTINGTYTANRAQITDNCGGQGKCLSSVNTKDRQFSLFDPGVTFWGTDLYNLGKVLGAEMFTVTVIGESGTSTFTQASNGFFGFSDSLGLTSVNFTWLGTDGRGEFGANYFFDNVTTAAEAAATVPEPMSLALVCVGLAGIAATRRKKKA